MLVANEREAVYRVRNALSHLGVSLPDVKTWKQFRKHSSHLTLDEVIGVVDNWYDEKSELPKLLNQRRFDESRVSRELVELDWRSLRDADLGRKQHFHLVSRHLAYDLMVRAIEGRAREGHGGFRGNPKENSNTLDVCFALSTSGKKVSQRGKKQPKAHFKPQSIMSRSQDLVSDTFSMFKDFFDHPELYVSPVKLFRKNDTFSGHTFLSGQYINMLEFARGFYFATCMDDYDVRQRIHKRYGVQAGGGECIPIDLNVLRDLPVSLEGLAKMNFDNELSILRGLDYNLKMEYLMHIGLIPSLSTPEVTLTTTLKDLKDQGKRLSVKSHLRSGFVRYDSGKGVSDDTALVLASFLSNDIRLASYEPTPYDAISRMLGAYLADFIDTVEKQSLFQLRGGWDGCIGNYIATRFRELSHKDEFRKQYSLRRNASGELIREVELLDFIAASLNSGEQKVHSSQRYFCKDLEGTSTLKQLFIFLHNKFTELLPDQESSIYTPNELQRPGICFTFERIPSAKYYKHLSDRVALIASPRGRNSRLAIFYKQSH